MRLKGHLKYFSIVIVPDAESLAAARTHRIYLCLPNGLNGRAARNFSGVMNTLTQNISHLLFASNAGHHYLGRYKVVKILLSRRGTLDDDPGIRPMSNMFWQSRAAMV